MVTRPAQTAAGRQRPWLLAGLGLLLLAGGVLAGRATVDTDPAPAAQPPAPADAKDDQPRPGPTGKQAGVPVGYTPDEAGAVAAATAYTVTFGGPLLFDDRLDDALDVAASETARDELDEQFAEGAGLLTERLNLDGRDVVAPTAPAGYRIEEFAQQDTAAVSVWAAGFMIAGQAPVPTGWTTTTIELVWADGDWKLAGLRSSDGPAPPEDSDAGAVAQAATEIEGFDDYRHVPAEAE